MTGVQHLRGETFHGRRGVVGNRFRYGIDYVLLDPALGGPFPALFSRNRANLTSVRDRDHGGAPGKGRGLDWVHEVLANHDLARPDQIRLLTQPRVLGHVFNPVSFWLGQDNDGTLRWVIAEVSNTFGDRHSYLCHHVDLRPIRPEDRLTAQKIFHVSPFQPVEGDYVFRFDIGADKIGIWIDYVTQSGGVLATLTGHLKPLTSWGILGACLRRPLGSRRVLALIHWQALKLYMKGAGYRTRPEPPREEVSR
jgi:uncharacterized protein